MPMTNQISRDELRSAIADKLCAHFGVTAETATDEQVFQAAAIVIREILSRPAHVRQPHRRPSARCTTCRWSFSWGAR